MTAQTPTSAVEALRALALTIRHSAARVTPYFNPATSKVLGAWADEIDALAASQEAPKEGDTPEIIEGATYFTKDGRTVSAWRITADDGVYCSDLRYYCASELSLTPPASQGDAAPAGPCNCPGVGKLDPAKHAPNCPCRAALDAYYAECRKTDAAPAVREAVDFVAEKRGDYWTLQVNCGGTWRHYAIRMSDGCVSELPDGSTPFAVFPPTPAADGNGGAA